jgi:glutathione synthase/RimK-type ligase-like ATP-grasp enzyme
LLVVLEGDREPSLADLPTLTADEYLEGARGGSARGAVVVNLCRSYAYLSKGYYVSLLADARGQRALPSLETIEQINNPFAYFRELRELGLDTIDFKLVQSKKRLLPRVIVGDPGRPRMLDAGGERAGPDGSGPSYHPTEMAYIETTAVFGSAGERRFARQGRTTFRRYAFPALRMRMFREDDCWKMGQIFPAPFHQLSAGDRTRLVEKLKNPTWLSAEPAANRPKPYRIACLFDPNDPQKPSWEDTLDKFDRAALRKGALFETIGLNDLARLPEFDALFIRTLTGIGCPSFAFAQRAASLDIPVIDDPESIARCSNKVYLHELFAREDIPTPKTLIVSRRTPIETIMELGPPTIVKLPQGSFSLAVKKADDRKALEEILKDMFRQSPLLIVQEFTPTPFDWRIGVMDGRILFAAKYHQAKAHWQIARKMPNGATRFGKVEAVAIEAVPASVRKVALRGSKLIGDGLYGVDLKEVNGKALMIEINDNPNIETGYEDVFEKDKLYDAVIASFLRRIRKGAAQGALQGPSK